MNRRGLRIAIDGPAGAGKTVVGKLAAEKLRYRFFDTGMVYRALALAAMDSQVPSSDEERLYELARRIQIDPEEPRTDDASTYRAIFNGKDLNARLREPSVSEMASKVSALGSVRQGLLELQRRVIGLGGVVAAGRDVGTVVVPDAELKIFLTASPEERAKRRFQEILRRGQDADYRSVLAEIKERDDRDTRRALSPTTPADDAIVVNTDDMTVQQVVDSTLEMVKARSST